MRCPQCGNEAQAGAAFCSRCGARLEIPRPEARREYALARFRCSWWRYTGSFVLAAIMFALAAGSASRHERGNPVVFLIVGLLILGLTALSRLGLGWSLTSERLIERRGILATRRREIELADIRSVEVDRRLFQRMLGTGTVSVASAASTDFLIKLEDVADPEAIAATLRQARLKRLA